MMKFFPRNAILYVSPDRTATRLSALVIFATAVSAEIPAGTEEAYELDSYVVRSAADWSSNQFSRDDFAKFGQQNAAEALRSVSGVSVELDQGDARFIIIRGVDPSLNNITVNGLPVASTSAESRAAQLDVLELEGVESIELTKVLRPDQPADSVGGQVDFQTASAFDFAEQHLILGGAGHYHELSDQFGGQGNVRFCDRFMDGKLGVFLSASYSDRGLGSDALEVDSFEELDDGFVPSAIEYKEFDLQREKIGASFNIEYQLNPRTLFFMRGSLNQLEDEEYSQRWSVDFEDALENDNLSLVGDALSVLDTSDLEIAQGSERKDARVRQFLLNLGGEHQVNRWEFDYALGVAHGEEREEETVLSYVLDDAVGSATLNSLSDSIPRTALTPGVGNAADASGYVFDEAETELVDAEETNLNLSLNVARSFRPEWLNEIKSGLLFQFKDRETDVEVYEFENEPDALSGLIQSSNRDRFDTGFPGISSSLSDLFDANQGGFDSERNLEESIGGDFTSDEDVYAGYLQAEFSYGQFELLVGARVEVTDFESTGADFDESLGDGPFPGRTRGNGYTNILPGVHLSYYSKDRIDSTDAWTLKLAWTNTIARPGFEETKAGSITLDDFVEIGNPELDPLESTNYDLLVRYDHFKFGAVGLELFYKDLENLTISRLTNINDDIQQRTFENSPNGYVQGVELSYETPLELFPAPFDGFYFSCSAAFLDGESSISGRRGKQELLRQSDFVGKAGLTWSYRNFLAQLTYNYRSSYLDEFGDVRDEDEFVEARGQLDCSFSIAPTDSWLCYLNIQNITNEPVEFRFRNPDRVTEYEEFGALFTLGVRYSF